MIIYMEGEVKILFMGTAEFGIPTLKVLNDNYKISAKNSHSDIQNLDLSINSLKEGKFKEDYKNLRLQNTIEPNLLEEEKAVSLDMKEALENSISLALKSLENQEIISSEEFFFLF